jgi:peptidoglycan/xylan/chitin deacetylase (PgdA/CDA1 family)
MKLVSLLFHDVYERSPRESGFASDAADRYKLSIADFDAQLAGLASACGAAPLCDRGASPPSPFVRGASPLGLAKRHWLLTFDDGGISYYTHIADRLEALGWRGHCFMTTDYIGRGGFLDVAQLRELDARGHVIGSHSGSHPTRFSILAEDDMRREWTRSRKRLEDILGHAVTVASVPGGYFSKAVAHAADAAGLRTLFTSEPTTTAYAEADCTVCGRFVIRRGHRNDIARRFVRPAPWTRCSAWAGWNAKALVKPVLGTSYMRIADWLLRRPEGLRLPGRREHA